MSQNVYATPDSWGVAAEASTEDRSNFITKTYLHLFGAILAFTGLQFALYQTGMSEMAFGLLGGAGMWGILIVIGVFMGVSMLAHNMAHNATNLATQYLCLAAYVVLESLIFMPLIFICVRVQAAQGMPIIAPAAIFTMGLFAVLTAVVFITRKDFSFMRSFLMFAGFAAMGLIVCSIIFGFGLGVIFSFALAVLMCGYILYDTSNVLHHYRTNQHVAASLALFASVATLFYYVLRIALYLAAAGDD